jgi:4-hydroxy-tetrahydrodipicolinate reductase
MISICFAGITGWTAPPIVAAIDAADDLTLSAGVSRSAAGQTLAAATGSRSEGSVHATVAEALRSSTVDVLVDYTSAAAVKDNVWTAVRAGVHVVVGSSGLTSGDYDDELDRLAREHGVGVVAAGNFSIMAALLRRAAAIAAQHVDRWEIVDYASAGKPDVPSGTSRELAETLGQVLAPESAVPLSDLRGPVEARGTDVAGSRIHSVRLPSFVVTTEIVFAGPGERLIMRHDPGETPEPYVGGTLLAIRKVADVPGVVERQRLLLDLLAGHPDPAALVATFLRPPLYTTAYAEGFSTLYAVAYRPTIGAVDYVWPGSTWRRGFDSPSAVHTFHAST